MFVCLFVLVCKAHGYYTIWTYPFEEKRIGNGFETQNNKHYHLSYAVWYDCLITINFKIGSYKNISVSLAVFAEKILEPHSLAVSVASLLSDPNIITSCL